MSKRQGDVSVEDFRAKGYLREAIINFIVLLGWHPKNDNELFTIKQLEKEFKSTDIRSSGSIFDIDKLDYFNAHYIRQKSIDELYELCSPYLEKNIGLSTDKRKTTSEFIKSVISLEQERMKKISDISDLTRFFFLDKLEYPKELLIWKKLELSDVKNNLEELITILEEVSDKEWNSENLEKKIISYIKDNNKKTGDYLWPMRVALTGERASPSPFDVAGVLGREESLGRIKKVKEL